MTPIEARAAVRNFVATHWSQTPVVWPNPTIAGKGPPKKVDDAAPIWIACEWEIISSETGLGSPGKRLATDIGQLVINGFAPVSTGDDDLFETVSSFAEMFRMLKLQGLQFQSPNLRTMEAGDDKGAWFVMNATIEWSLYRAV
jgi:hypothetical protein